MFSRFVSQTGAYTGISVVDVTNLAACDIYVAVGEEAATSWILEGRRRAVGKVDVTVTTIGGGQLALKFSDAGSGSVSISNTGNANAGAGGIAITGFVGQGGGARIRVENTGDASADVGGAAVSGVSLHRGTPRIFRVQNGAPFVRECGGSPASLRLWVPADMLVLYY